MQYLVIGRPSAIIYFFVPTSREGLSHKSPEGKSLSLPSSNVSAPLLKLVLCGCGEPQESCPQSKLMGDRTLGSSSFHGSRDWLAAASSGESWCCLRECGEQCVRTWAGRLTGISGQLCEGTWVPGEERRSRFWWWMMVLPEAGLLLAELIPRCGRWGAVWDRELLLPKGTFRGLGSPDGSIQGKEFWDLRSSRSALGRLHQLGCLLTGSLCRQEELTSMCWLLRLSLLFFTLPCGCFSPSCCGERSSGAGKLLAEYPSY